MGRKLITGYRVERNKEWYLAIKKQKSRCARCDGSLNSSIKVKQKKSWLVDKKAYCGTCSRIIKDGKENEQEESN
tara:strand:+ start:18400 stop:18624 length:225 start_codon:yes stop_codon:yes gene_type:complete